MLKRSLWLMALVLIAGGVAIHAQDSDCSVLVQEALTQVDTLCDTTGRNQACYGNVLVEASAIESVADFQFESPGDIGDVAHIEALQLSPLRSPEEWGIVLMKIQASLPDTLPGQNVTVLAFGDVFLQNQVGIPVEPITGTITASANLRSGPGTNFAVVEAGTSGQSVLADGRNEAGDWFRIRLEDSDESVWIFQSLITLDSDPMSLPVVNADAVAGNFNPMQAFYFTSGVGSVGCAEAPQDGILIQTPTGAGRVQLQANNIEIDLGSTIYMTAISNDVLTISVLDGEAIITVADATVTVPAGLSAEIAVDADALPVSEPIIVPYEIEALASLPIDGLDETIEINEPPDIDFTQYAGTWEVTTGEYVCESNGAVLLQDGVFTMELAADATGLRNVVSDLPLAIVEDNHFALTFIGEGDYVYREEFIFTDANAGIYTVLFDPNGVETFACNEVATTEGTMVRLD